MVVATPHGLYALLKASGVKNVWDHLVNEGDLHFFRRVFLFHSCGRSRCTDISTFVSVIAIR